MYSRIKWGAMSFRYIWPSFITNRSLSNSVISARGSPASPSPSRTLPLVSKCDISECDMQVKDKNQDADRPLSSAALHILLALAESDLHGYGIMQSVKRQSDGKFRLGPGTLYANLDRLLASGLVGETERKMKNGETRREYCLTSSGERVLRLEVSRLRQMVNVARNRLGKLDEREA